MTTAAEAWYDGNRPAITELQEAVTAAAGGAGDLARAIDATTPNANVGQAAELAAFHARNLLAIIRRMRGVPPVPDSIARAEFRRVLDLWQQGAAALERAASDRDAVRGHEAGRFFEQADEAAWRWNAAMARALG